MVQGPMPSTSDCGSVASHAVVHTDVDLRLIKRGMEFNPSNLGYSAFEKRVLGAFSVAAGKWHHSNHQNVLQESKSIADALDETGGYSPHFEQVAAFETPKNGRPPTTIRLLFWVTQLKCQGTPAKVDIVKPFPFPCLAPPVPHPQLHPILTSGLQLLAQTAAKAWYCQRGLQQDCHRESGLFSRENSMRRLCVESKVQKSALFEEWL